MTPRKYIVNAKDRVLRRKARQQKAAENLHTLIQDQKTPLIFNISKFRQDFESIVKNIDGFIRQLQTPPSVNTTEIAGFMSEKALEVKTLRESLPRSRSTTEFKRELKVYEKMVLDFPKKLALEIKNRDVMNDAPYADNNKLSFRM